MAASCNTTKPTIEQKQQADLNNQQTQNTASSNSTSQTPRGWLDYKNSSLGLKFSYPQEWGSVADNGNNAYVSHNIVFSGDNNSVARTSVNVYTDKSVNDWEAKINESKKAGEAIGDPRTVSHPLSVKNLLATKPVGYNCLKDFGDFLAKDNSFCQIVDINGNKVFKIITAGPFQSETSVIKYLFYLNGSWYEFSRSFWLYSQSDPNKQIYTYAQLNNILQGKSANAEIKAKVDTFNQFISTVTFEK